MAKLVPGEKFTITYGNDEELTVKALSGNGQRKLGKVIRALASVEDGEDKDKDPFGIFDLAFEALSICLGEDKAEKMYENDVDAELAMEIATKVLGKNQMSEDDRKKSE